MSARGRLIFSRATPLRETTGNGCRTDVGVIAKQVVLGLIGQRKLLGKDGKRFSDRAETQKELDELQMCLEIIWAKHDSKKMAVLTDEGEPGREVTPDGENGELVPLTFDTRANEDLWNLLFLVCDNTHQLSATSGFPLQKKQVQILSDSDHQGEIGKDLRSSGRQSRADRQKVRLADLAGQSLCRHRCLAELLG